MSKTRPEWDLRIYTDNVKGMQRAVSRSQEKELALNAIKQRTTTATSISRNEDVRAIVNMKLFKTTGRLLWSWLRKLWARVLRVSTQGTAGWVLICFGCFLFGTAYGFMLGAGYASSLFGLGYDTLIRDHRAFSIWTAFLGLTMVPLFLGFWMLRHARRRERGLPPDRLTFLGGIAESIKNIREAKREARRLAEERARKKAILDSWKRARK